MINSLSDRSSPIFSKIPFGIKAISFFPAKTFTSFFMALLLHALCIVNLTLSVCLFACLLIMVPVQSVSQLKLIHPKNSSPLPTYDVLPRDVVLGRRFHEDYDQFTITMKIKNDGPLIKQGNYVAVTATPVGFLNKFYQYYLNAAVVLREDLSESEEVPVTLKWEVPRSIMDQDSAEGMTHVCVEVRSDGTGPNLESGSARENSCDDVRPE